MELEAKAKEIRRTVLEMIVRAGRGHIGGSFSCVEILVALYYGGILKFDPHNPAWPDRDRLILSKGHACPTLYAILADLGFFDESELDHFNAEGALLEGHPNANIPGIEVGTGSLGHGLSIGCGMALAAKMGNKTCKTFVLMGDAECQEGSVWEAAMFAGHHKLDNLIVIIDNNGQGVLDHLPKYSFPDTNYSFSSKLASFGWYTINCDGHDFKSILMRLPRINSPRGKPIAIIAETIKGKGISFMERAIEYHHHIPSGIELEQARIELGVYVCRARQAISIREELA